MLKDAQKGYTLPIKGIDTYFIFLISSLNTYTINIRAWSNLPEFENSTSFSNFLKPEPENNTVFKDCQNQNSKKPKNWNSIIPIICMYVISKVKYETNVYIYPPNLRKPELKCYYQYSMPKP